jgi:DNA-binding response OmpR family regulator
MHPSIRVLLVEDDPLVIITVEEALTDGGFAVSTAADGAKAVSLLEAPDADYRALVTDVNLLPGGLTGWDVARRARELRADVPVVYTTGEAADNWTAMGVPNSVLVPKPFAPAQIITAVSQLLNQGNTPGA